MEFKRLALSQDTDLQTWWSIKKLRIEMVRPHTVGVRVRVCVREWERERDHLSLQFIQFLVAQDTETRRLREERENHLK